jgi:hypothetical protein
VTPNMSATSAPRMPAPPMTSTFSAIHEIAAR